MNPILLIEDDKNLSESLTQYLVAEGFQVIQSHNLKSAWQKLSNQLSIIILDWMLPDGQGIDFLRELRKTDVVTPILLLTSRTDLVDKVVGLESGANDYMTKPFEPRELVARIRSHVRTKDSFSEANRVFDKIEISGITLIGHTREVKFKDKNVELTKMEYHLLKLFLENPGRVFPRESLLNDVWGYESFPTTRTVDNHILQLRQKFNSDMFETVRGVGYRFRVLEK